MLARENFDGQYVLHNRIKLSQACQNGQTSHPPNPGAPRRAFSQARPQPMKALEAYPMGRTVRRIRSTTSVRAAEW